MTYIKELDVGEEEKRFNADGTFVVVLPWLLVLVNVESELELLVKNRLSSFDSFLLALSWLAVMVGALEQQVEESLEEASDDDEQGRLSVEDMDIVARPGS